MESANEDKNISDLQIVNRGKRIYKKKKPWKLEEESLLITLWGDYIDDFRGCRKNSHVYQEISDGMKSNDFNFSQEEVRVKIHNLTNKYRDKKRKVGPSGGTPSNWPYFERVHRILGSFKSNSIELVMDESIADTPSTSNRYSEAALEPVNDSSQISLDESFTAPPPKRKKSFQTIMLDKIKESNEIIRKEVERGAEVDSKIIQLQEELIEVEKERNEILKSLLNK